MEDLDIVTLSVVVSKLNVPNIFCLVFAVEA